jgi:hypothetical protein
MLGLIAFVIIVGGIVVGVASIIGLRRAAREPWYHQHPQPWTLNGQVLTDDEAAVAFSRRRHRP